MCEKVGIRPMQIFNFSPSIVVSSIMSLLSTTSFLFLLQASSNINLLTLYSSSWRWQWQWQWKQLETEATLLHNAMTYECLSMSYRGCPYLKVWHGFRHHKCLLKEKGRAIVSGLKIVTMHSMKVYVRWVNWLPNHHIVDVNDTLYWWIERHGLTWRLEKEM